jgi:hypothetical protein
MRADQLSGLSLPGGAQFNPLRVVAQLDQPMGRKFINDMRVKCVLHGIFQKIDQENDVGIDALVELVKSERPTGNFIATQIKSGNSYFDKKSNLCKIPIGDHTGSNWSKSVCSLDPEH